MRAPLVVLLLALVPLAACEKKKSQEAAKPAATIENIESKEILDRTDETPGEVMVKHVLIGWKDLADAYRGRMDERAKKRTQEEAAALAGQIRDTLRAKPDQIDAQVQEHSEDPGSLGGKPYPVTAGARFVPEFKAMALRLKEGEVGVVKTSFGYHVMMRVAPPPPDPLESADILARPEPKDPGVIHVQHVLIGWKDAPAMKQRPGDPRATARTKADADKLAKDVLDKVRAGGDMTALMKELSEDPGSKDDGKTYEVTPQARLVPPFKALSLRLNMGEAGMVITDFGWHVIKRVEPPPPPPPPPPSVATDPLDSKEILERAPTTEKANVKHILLGWTEFNSGDERGTKRSRADLEKLVKKTLARLKKGEKIEDLMKELSEDGGSAQSGQTYEATPTARLVPPFRDLSLRLKVGEVGVVKTQFGIHIIKRID